jgi:DtxR family Mn-dependent transcriptional regulator
MNALAICLSAALLAAILGTPKFGLVAKWRRLSAYRAKSRSEDALKHILAWQHRSKLATLESLAGTMGLRPTAVLRLVAGLRTAGWIESSAAGIALTESGERRALQVVRAHRLWERHLSDDANMPMGKLHQAAERAEHSLSREQVAELDAHLGHPEHDPHGDPIPSPDGAIAELNAVSLNEWPIGKPALIAHLEDEPQAVFRQILSAKLRPMQVVRVAESGPGHLLVDMDGGQRRIEHSVAANIHVREVQPQDSFPRDRTRLSDLAQGTSGEVTGLSPDCQGLSRRRLLDLGITPGTSMEVALDSTFGDPRAFRVRGTTIALRQQQAEHIWVRPHAPSGRAEG